MTRKTRKDRTAAWIRMTPVIVLAAAVLVYFVWRSFSESRPEPEVPAEPAVEQSLPGGGGATLPGGAEGRGYTAAERDWVDLTGSPPQWPADFDRPAACNGAARELRALCERLDERAGLRPGDSFGLLTGAARDLAAAPPPVEGVLGDLDALRANISHLFRVLGEERTLRLLRLAGEHPEFAEPLALALWRWLRSDGRCDEGLPVPPDLRRQYEYAAFVLNTLGGQAYLRRRPPRLEALAGFYAVLTAERARRAGLDAHGAEWAKERDRCLELLRGPELMFRERYVDVLNGIR